VSRPDDRVAVPTNGHRPPLTAADVPGAVEAAVDTRPAPLAPDSPVALIDVSGPRLEVTLQQLALGAGVVASIVLLALGLRRRGPGA
jgi:hypothetical protein